MNKEKKIPGHILSLFIILLSISGVCLLMYKAQFRFNLHQPIEYVMMTTHKPTGTITLSSDSPVLTETFTCTVPELKMFTLEGTAKNKTSNARLFITLTNADSGEIYYQAEHTLSVFRATKKKELTCDLSLKVTGSFKTPMGCRSFLGVWENENGEQVHDGRNNLGVISLNLPRIALEAKGDEAAFWALLDERLQLARKALMTRIARLEGVKARVAPILYMEGACGVRLKADDDVSEIFKNGRASISLGYIGIHETINALYGNQHMYDSEALREKGVAIVQRLRDAVDLWKEETGYGFSLYSTPSENLCDRFCRLDTAEFGVVEGVTDKGYYTNSFHLDVEKKVNPYDKIDFEAPYPPLANGGFICYGEYPNIQHNLKALEDVWDYSYQHVPYYGTNTPIDECYECGFTGEFECTSKGFTCPKCGNHDAARVSVTRRVCGYLGSPDARPFNAGKQEEVKRRVKHLGNGQIG